MKFIRFYFRLSTAIMLFMAVAFLFIRHTRNRESSDIEKAMKAVNWMILPPVLSRSAFTIAFPDGKPSEFVNYMFSDMGIAEWPPYEGMNDEDLEEYSSIRIPMIPQSVSLVPLYPDPVRGRQLVIRFDDIRDVLILEGYEDPKGEPVKVKEWKLPKVEPAVGIRQIYDANLEQGMSDHAF